MPKSLNVKNREALNVSGAFDNCFFHTYATHILANNQGLPDDLFTFKSIMGDESPASMLQKKFASDTSLLLFEQQHKYTYPAQGAPSFIVEKTLILGFLLREWFATYMAENKETIAAKMQEQVLGCFKNYIRFRRDGLSADDLVSGPQGVLYQANKAFLEYAVLRNSPGAVRNPPFERYFSEVDADQKQAFQHFWFAEGYLNYCQYIALPGTTLSFADVAPIIEHLQQPLIIYDKSAIEQAETKKIIAHFNHYLNARVSGKTKEDLLSGDKKALFLANEKFLEYVILRSSAAFKQEDKVQEFETYFLGAPSREKVFEKFWLTVGHSNYNRFINQQSTQATDIDEQLLVIDEQYPPLIIYKNEGSAAYPRMEIALNVVEGHYWLMKTDDTAQLLEDYATSYTQYRKDKEAILRLRGDKIAYSETKSSIFVGATLPQEILNENPFTLLIRKIDALQTFVKEKVQQEVSLREQAALFPSSESISPIEAAIDVNPRSEADEEVNVVHPLNPPTPVAIEELVLYTESTAHNVSEPIQNIVPVDREEDLDQHELLAVEPLDLERPMQLTDNNIGIKDSQQTVMPDIEYHERKQALFNKHLKALKAQVANLNERREAALRKGKDHYENLNQAYEKAKMVHCVLQDAGQHYFAKEISHDEFKARVKAVVRDAMPVLETHRGLKGILESIINFFRTITNKNHALFKIETKSMKQVNAVVDSVNESAPGTASP